MNLKGKHVLIIGMARSGVSAAKLCKKLQANVIVHDSKSREQLSEVVEELEREKIGLLLGENPDSILAEQDLLILSPGVPTDLGFINKARELGIVIWSEIELAYTYCPCPIIAITGTNGKTTTTSLVGEIFRNSNPDTYVVGNIGIPFSDEVLKMNKDSIVIAEISSFQLETCAHFRPRISAVLNITPDHLNRHKTFENYIAAKERIFMNQKEDDICVLNYEDEHCRKMKDKTKSKVFFFSSRTELLEGVFLQDSHIVVKKQGEIQTICHIDELKILGIHSIENAMAAVAMAVCAGIPVEMIKNAVISFKALEHRIEYVETINDVEYYNDSKATNPDAAIPAIHAMKRPTILIGGGMDKGNDFTDWIKAFDKKVKELIVIGETSDIIIETAKLHKFNHVQKVETLQEAVHKASELAQRGDCVLLSPACASWDMFDSYEQRGRIFKNEVKALKG